MSPYFSSTYSYTVTQVSSSNVSAATVLISIVGFMFFAGLVVFGIMACQRHRHNQIIKQMQQAQNGMFDTERGN